MRAMPADARQAALSGGLLLYLASAPVLASTACWQWHDAGREPLPDCQRTDTGLALGPAALSQLRHDQRGLARIQSAGQFHYHHRSGRQLQVPAMDNGADDFQRGLVRGIVAARYGFFHRPLKPRIAANFDGALPFDPASGSAWVCRGCRLSAPAADGQRSWVGGTHWQINTTGKPVP